MLLARRVSSNLTRSLTAAAESNPLKKRSIRATIVSPALGSISNVGGTTSLASCLSSSSSEADFSTLKATSAITSPGATLQSSKGSESFPADGGNSAVTRLASIISKRTLEP